MSTNDIQVKDVGGLNVLPTRVCQTEAGATALLPGEPVKLKSAGSPFVILLADAEPVIGTTTEVVGITKSASTHTASVNGTVEVYIPNHQTVFSARAKSAAAANTVAEILALENDRVVFDFTSSAFTVDTAAGDAAASGIQIVGGNPDTSTIHFKFRSSALQGPIA